ncbi:MAG: asparagine--tRNA ligase [Acetobacteraceae bacterium]|nr:asparagine--tRNA ligase [Acetobacteraceae bacterium]
MAEGAFIRDVASFEGREVEIRGWVYNSRSSGRIHFLILRDGTGFMQAVAVQGQLPDRAFQAAGFAPQEAAVVARGLVRADRRAPGGYELELRDLEVLQGSPGYPLTLKEHGVEFLMDHRHLWIRSPRQHALLRVRAELIAACRDFLDSDGFTLVDAPILTPAAAEGTTTLFEIRYFDRSAYLTQSGQLYNEAAAMAFGKVYCYGPTFRAEKSKTRRHLIEFWMIEPEMAYCDLEQCLEVEERMVSAVVARVVERRRPELAVLGRDVSKLEKIRPPFPRISYDEAVEMLQRAGHSIKWGDDFGAPDESYISQQFDLPVFVLRYPAACKAFYMQPDPARPEVVLGADLLAPEGYGEIIGGGQRIHDLELLQARIREHGLNEANYGWYLDLRRYGSVPHSGFGLGIERTLAWMAGLEHIREAIPFPRLLHRIYP